MTSIKDMNEWAEQEFPDSDKIINMDRGSLYFEIWKGRSNKTIILLVGIFIGLSISYVIPIIKNIFQTII